MCVRCVCILLNVFIHYFYSAGSTTVKIVMTLFFLKVKDKNETRCRLKFAFRFLLHYSSIYLSYIDLFLFILFFNLLIVKLLHVDIMCYRCEGVTEAKHLLSLCVCLLSCSVKKCADFGLRVRAAAEKLIYRK